MKKIKIWWNNFSYSDFYNECDLLEFPFKLTSYNVSLSFLDNLSNCFNKNKYLTQVKYLFLLKQFDLDSLSKKMQKFKIKNKNFSDLEFLYLFSECCLNLNNISFIVLKRQFSIINSCMKLLGFLKCTFYREKKMYTFLEKIHTFLSNLYISWYNYILFWSWFLRLFFHKSFRKKYIYICSDVFIDFWDMIKEDFVGYKKKLLIC